MSCVLGKSLILLFYFAKNSEDDFSLRYAKFGYKVRLPCWCVYRRQHGRKESLYGYNVPNS